MDGGRDPGNEETGKGKMRKKFNYMGQGGERTTVESCFLH